VTVAITRPVSRSIAHCELTHLARSLIDLDVARDQHAAYEAALESLGVRIERLPEAPDLPDAVFVEDCAVVFEELAVICRPGAASRRAEVPAVAAALAARRPLLHITAPGTLDGGDALVLDAEVVVGETARSNAEGVAQLRAALAPFGRTVRSVPVTGALHLKSAVTRAGQRTLLMNRAWVDADAFPGWDVVTVDPSEPFAGNALWLDPHVIHAESFPLTRERLAAAGVPVVTVPASELAKAEGGVTCCALLVRGSRRLQGA